MIQYGIFEVDQVKDGKGGFIEEENLVYSGFGYLDMLTGTHQNVNQNSLVVQSTHILIIPYNPHKPYGLATTGDIVKVDGKRYRIQYIDNPMQLYHHLEVYLKGEQDG